MRPRAGSSAPGPRRARARTSATSGERTAAPTVARIDPTLGAALHRRASPNGFLPFDRFLEVVLYDPDAGYYARERPPVGREGDYRTAAESSALFAEVTARRLREVWRGMGAPSPWHLAELGPGDGRFAARLLSALTRPSDGIPALVYEGIDRSAARRNRLAERLGSIQDVTVRTPESIGELAPFSGAVLGLEFLDSLPFRRLVRRAASWRELGVRLENDRLMPAEDELPGRASPPSLPECPDGTVLEVSPAQEAWVRELGDSMVRGTAIFVDYGASYDYWLHGRPGGTLQAFRDHRVVDPLTSPGSTDVTAFVNFDRVRAAGRRAGLREISYRRQRDALAAWGLPELADAATRSASDSAAQVSARLDAKSLVFGYEHHWVLEWAIGPPNGNAASGSSPPSR